MWLIDAIVDVLTGTDRKRIDEQRRSWRAVADRHGLTYVAGPHRRHFQGDRIEGTIDGRDLTVSCDANYDIQKLVVAIASTCSAKAPDMSPQDLVAWYER